MLCGEIHGTARNLLVAARLNMVPKNGNKYRPIRIECAVCRLFGAVASDIARKIVGPGLQPIQTGGGFRCGVEFGARMADLAYRQEDAIIAVDIANAFNTVCHGLIFSAILDRHSPIARFFCWKCGTPSEKRDHFSNIVAHTRTGEGQGDPWGGLFFQLGYQAALLYLSRHVTEEAAAYNRSHRSQSLPRSGHVVAYEDDTQVMGPPTLMFHIAPSIAPILAEHGFYMNVQKSYITRLSTDCFSDQPEDFNIHPDGLVILDVPTGGRTFRRTKANQILTDMILSRLTLFDFLALHHTPEYQIISNHFSRTDIHLGHQEALADHTGLTEEIMLSLTTPTARNTLTAAKTLAYKKQSEDLHSLLAINPISQQHAAWMLSSTDSSTNFVHSSIALGSEDYFSADEFRCIARAKLGLSPTNDPLG